MKKLFLVFISLLFFISCKIDVEHYTGTVKIPMKAYNVITNNLVAEGKSKKFTITEGDELNISVPMIYTDIKPLKMSFNYCFRNAEIETLNIKTIIFLCPNKQKNKEIRNIENYVSSLKSKAEELDLNWWDLWKHNDIPTDIDFRFVQLESLSISDRHFISDIECYYAALIDATEENFEVYEKIIEHDNLRHDGIGCINYIQGTTKSGVNFDKYCTRYFYDNSTYYDTELENFDDNARFYDLQFIFKNQSTDTDGGLTIMW